MPNLVRMKRKCGAIFFFGLFFSVKAVDFSRVNIAWQYHPEAPVKLAHRVYEKNNNTVVFLKIRTDSLAAWKFDFLVQDGYESEKEDKLIFESIDTLRSTPGTLELKLALGRISKNLMVVKIYQYDQPLYYDVPLKVGQLPFPEIYPKDAAGYPIYEPYIHRSGHVWAEKDSVYIKRYAANFARADAPMAEMKAMATTVPMDSAYFSHNAPSFKEDYFYMVSVDTVQSGVTMLRVPPYFPALKRLQELVPAMLYLTSEAEEKALKKSKDLKKDFDSFWINNLNTKPRARNAIRKYYLSVKQANLLFTDFKPGWQTDRGMLYILYGAPDEVYRQNGFEEWYYDTGERFEFNVISSFFAAQTYFLRRQPDYEERWFQKIAEIRKGIR